jgi:hypothetical protein
MKTAILVFLFAANSLAADLINFNFDELRNCKAGFSYERVFLFDGRGLSEHLERDAGATELAKTIHFGKNLEPVTEAYSIALFRNYIHYESLKPIVDRLAIVLVKAQVPLPERPYDLILFASEGPARGTVLAAHPADFDLTRKILESKFFSCSK